MPKNIIRECVLAVLCVAGPVPAWAGAQALAAQSTQPAPGEIETVYIVPMSHVDVGFTAPPRDVAAQSARRVEQALKFAREDAGYVWNCEVFWELDQWLDPQKQPGFPPRRPGSTPASTQPAPTPESLREMLELVRQGRFGIGAAYVNPHTSLMSGWALDQLFRIPAEWARRQGLTLDWAAINDVPGHPPDLPKFLAGSGVRYLLLGVNQSLSKPLPKEVWNVPFWWEAPDGSRVLTWIAGKGGYTEAFIEYGVDPGTARWFNSKVFTETQPLEVIRHGMERLLKDCRERKYPYDAVVLMHAFDNWDAGAASRLPGAVRLWNESGGKPRLVLATPDRFFRHIEAKYGPQLPVRRGGFGGQWELIRTTHPSAIGRARAREAELLRADQSPADEIRRQLVFWEHSYSLSTPWPGHLTREQAIAQNVQQWDMVADWPMAKLPVGRGQLFDLPNSQTDGPFRPNGLCLAGSTFITWKDFKPLPAGTRIESMAERIEGDVVRCRHCIDRRTLPDPGNVIWTWRLTDEEATAPVLIQTATGTMSWPQDGLADYAQYHWVAPWGFQIGRTRFVPRGPFAFARPPEHPGWLLGYVLSQGRAATFRGGQKAEMTFEEVYQGEEPVHEFTVDIGPAPRIPALLKKPS